MENAVISFLNDIVSEIHAPHQIGPNRFVVEMKGWTDLNGIYIYVGNKRHLYCEQYGQEIYIDYGRTNGPNFQINLADPNSRELIANIFRTN
jgi:hypothetical protein